MPSLIGMVIPDGTNQFFSELALQTQRQLANRGYPMVVLNSDNSLENEAKGLDTLFELGVKGIVFVSVGDNESVYHLLRDSHIPVVIMDREIPETEECDFVISDNKIGVIEAVEYLHAVGHQKIGIIKGLQNTDPGRVRYSAYREGLEKCKLKHYPRLEFEGEFDFWSGEKAAEDIYNLAKEDRPTAVIACNDLMAFGLIQNLERLEIHVPSEVSVIGFDDIPLSRWANPKLSSIRQDINQIAMEAAELLSSRIEGRHSGEHRLRFVEPRLIKRDSVKIIG